jgi:branched-chain amino acid transport system substrate-binding protein
MITEQGTKLRRWRLGFIPALAISAVALASLYACSEDEPVRIGVIAGLTGRSADIGEASRNAVQLAIANQNARGGINGRPVEMLVRDDANDPDTGANAVRELHDLKVDAIIGPNVSSVAAGMLPVIDELGVVTISPTVSSLVFAERDDSFFRINWTTRDNAQIYARRLIERGFSRTAVAADAHNRVFSDSWVGEFTKEFTNLGGTVAKTEYYDASQQMHGYAETAMALLKWEPDAILLVSNSIDTAHLAQQIRKLDTDVPLTAAEWAASERLLQLGGSAIEGVELIQSYNRFDMSERFSAFRQDYVETFGRDPGYSSIAAHDAATILIAAMEADPDFADLKESLINIGTVEGLQQSIRFDAYGDGQRRAFFVVVRNGKFEIVNP